MPITVKRSVFFSLFLTFLVYTWVVSTAGTEVDEGKSFYNVEAAAGKLLFQKYNCGSCHQLYGLGGYMGPDLTNALSDNSGKEAYIRAILKTGTAKMPDFKLTDKEINELVAFLNYIDKTGASPVLDYSINYDGTVDVGKKK